MRYMRLSGKNIPIIEYTPNIQKNLRKEIMSIPILWSINERSKRSLLVVAK